MFRKLSIILVIGLLAFAAACSSTSSTVSNAAAGATGSNVAAAPASATPGACPTSSTKSFAKTRFVADIALAGGAFKRYIYTPAKAGQFKKGADGKTKALIKAVAAGAFTLNRLNAAKNAAEADPTLCKVLAAPIANFTAEIHSLIDKAKGGAGSINPGDVTSSGSSLSDLHSAASQGGAAFTDNQDTSA